MYAQPTIEQNHKSCQVNKRARDLEAIHRQCK